jgi:ribosomal protein S18 acetylase RimI-like enzyme
VGQIDDATDIAAFRRQITLVAARQVLAASDVADVITPACRANKGDSCGGPGRGAAQAPRRTPALMACRRARRGTDAQPPQMTVIDWRDVPSAVVQPLLLAERRHALGTLHWDLTASLQTVELARQRSDLAGFLVYDAKGRPVGWAFYLLANGLLQIGSLSAATAGGLRTLLDRVLESPEAQLAHGVSCFLEARSRSLTSALTRQRFDIERHVYLEASLATRWPSASTLPGARLLELGDAPALVRLLAKGYTGQRVAQTFAPNARMDEWAHYAGRLLNGPVAGTWRPDQSFVVTTPDGQMAAAVVTTEIARGIAHIAQVVVDPEFRRKGLARGLLLTAAAAARSQGATCLTLMVGETNSRAGALYDGLGFAHRGTFVHATRGPVPRTLGGVMVRATGSARAIARASRV